MSLATSQPCRLPLLGPGSAFTLGNSQLPTDPFEDLHYNAFCFGFRIKGVEIDALNMGTYKCPSKRAKLTVILSRMK